jgi:3-oxoacyl-(acyl-carrier-protein) synthase
MMNRRAVVTGIGVIAANGIGTETYWEATRQGKSGIKRISRFDPSRYATQVAGEVPEFEAAKYLDQRLIVQTDRWAWMALAATNMALADAGLDPAREDPYKIGVVTASSSGGNEFGQREIQNLWGKGPLFVGAYQSIAWFYAASTGQISIKHGLKGPCSVVISEGAGGLDGLAHARRMIRRGADVIVTGGTEAPIAPYALTCQIKSGLLSASADPVSAYRPFDARANGYVPGEGGAILILEDHEHAYRRGAPCVYAEIVGHGATHDGYHYRRPAPDTRQLNRAMMLALEDAQVRPEEVDIVFADAAGNLERDALEAKAIRDVFRGHARRVLVATPKTMVGRLYAGGASLDVATALLALRDGVVPPTINLERPADGCELNFAGPREQSMQMRTVLVSARGYGGFNSALVLRRLP